MKNEDLINKFNSMFPVGSKVRWRSVGKDGVPYEVLTVQDSATLLSGHSPVAWFKERLGCCSIEERFVDYTPVVEEIMASPSVQNIIDTDYNTLEKIVNQLALVGYHDDIGHPLENNVAFIALKQMAAVSDDSTSDRLEQGRHYLMSVNASEITVEDALEAFGFGRNGLDR